MIYTGSYFKPETHHGKVIRTSIGVPDGIRIDGALECFYPTPKLVHAWKQSQQTDADWESYKSGYWAILASRRDIVMPWIEGLNSHTDETLCCYEPFDTHCHRHLVGLLIRKYRPECWGGESIVKTVVEPATPAPTKTTKQAKGVGKWEVGAYVKHRLPESVPGQQGWRGQLLTLILPNVFEVDWIDQKEDLKQAKTGHRDHVFRKQPERYPTSVLYLVDRNGNPYAS